jgi:crossover junction endodeoxyribonuclease RusA
MLTVEKRRKMPSTEARVILPWPDKALSPNARGHWAKRSRAVKTARSQSYLLTRQSMTEQPGTISAWHAIQNITDAGTILVRIVFEPPGRYRYDLDNLVARRKAGLDGIADAVGIDDHRFQLESPVIGDTFKPHGRVCVTLTT